MIGMSGPWLYSAVDQACARDTNPIQKIGIDPTKSSVNHNTPPKLSGWVKSLGPD